MPRDPMSLGQPWPQNSGFQGAWRVACRIQQDVGDNKAKAVDVDYFCRGADQTLILETTITEYTHRNSWNILEYRQRK